MKRNKRTTFSTLRVLVAAGLLILALTGIGLLMGCGAGMDEPDVIPEIGLGAATSRLVMSEDQNSTYPFYVAAPMMTGWEKNSNGVTVGQILQGSFLGEDVSVSMSQDQGTFTFEGTLEGGQFTATYTPSTKLFGYSQDVLIHHPFAIPGFTQRGFTYVRSVFTDVKLDENGYFHTEFTCYVSMLLDADSDPGLDSFMFIGPTEAEFFSGIISSTGHKVAGFVSKPGGKYSPTNLSADPLSESDITFEWYKTKMDEFVNTYNTNPGSLQDSMLSLAAGLFDYETGTEPTVDNQIPNDSTLDELDAHPLVPWDIIRD